MARRPIAACSPGWCRTLAATAAITGLALAVIWASIWHRAGLEREQAAGAILRANANLAIAYEENAIAALRQVDEALAMAAFHERVGLTAAPSPREAWPLSASLVKGVGLAGPAGELLIGNGEVRPGERRHLAALRRHAVDPSPEMLIGRAEPNGAGGWRLVISRRREEEGAFAGVAFAVVDPAYFTAFYGRADLGAGGAVSLIGSDGRPVARRAGARELFGSSEVIEAYRRERARAPVGWYRGLDGPGGSARLYSYRAVRGYPLTVRVGISEADAMEPTRQRARLYFIGALVLSVVIVSVAGFVLRSLARQRRYIHALRESGRQLRARDAFIGATLDQTLLGIARADREGRFVRVNRAFCDMLGYEEAELLRMRPVDVTHPDDYPASRERIRALGSGEKSSQQLTKRYVRKDGGIVWTLTTVTRVCDERGEPAFVGMIQDISELKRAERLKGEFVSTVSHELRTPLTSIHGSLGLLAGGVAGALPGPAQELVGIARRNCERLLRLVSDILATDRIDSGRMRFDLRLAELRALVKHAIDCNHGMAAEAGVSVDFVRPGEAVYAHVDFDRFSQAITNLLGNAVRFSPRGGVVEVALSQGDGRARVAIRDEGPGIPEEFRPRMFRPFSQADSSDARAKGGTGLGLYIAKTLMERMGGSIGFESAPGRGATFFLEIPVAPAPEVVPPALQAARERNPA